MDSAVRKRGRRAGNTDWSDHIVVPRGVRKPSKGAKTQFIFKCSFCAEGKQHYRCMNVQSVESLYTLLCRTCNDSEAAKRIVREAEEVENCEKRQAGEKTKKGRPAPRTLSAGEQALLHRLDTNPSCHGPQAYAHEVKLFVGAHVCDEDKPLLRSSPADVVFYSSNPPDHREPQPLALYWDGEHHFCWEDEGKRARDQHATDRAISVAAARAGYCVLRICWKDAHMSLSVIEAAWAVRDAAGWVKVLHWCLIVMLHIARSHSVDCLHERR
jgi:hypothetical protein